METAACGGNSHRAQHMAQRYLSDPLPVKRMFVSYQGVQNLCFEKITIAVTGRPLNDFTQHCIVPVAVIVPGPKRTYRLECTKSIQCLAFIKEQDAICAMPPVTRCGEAVLMCKKIRNG